MKPFRKQGHEVAHRDDATENPEDCKYTANPGLRALVAETDSCPKACE